MTLTNIVKFWNNKFIWHHIIDISATFTVNSSAFFFLLPAEINHKNPHRLVQITYGNVNTERMHSKPHYCNSHKTTTRFIIPLKNITTIYPHTTRPSLGSARWYESEDNLLADGLSLSVMQDGGEPATLGIKHVVNMNPAVESISSHLSCVFVFRASLSATVCFI